jgi:hypothetical protein
MLQTHLSPTYCVINATSVKLFSACSNEGIGPIKFYSTYKDLFYVQLTVNFLNYIKLIIILNIILLIT